MGDATCSVDGCDRTGRERGWCHMHYSRWWRTGDPLGRSRITTEERFWARVDVGDCWEWTGYRAPGGYGRFGVGRSKNREAHRWAWEHLVGPIPDGLEIDHLCRNHACVNPDHLEPVVQQINTLRGENYVARHARKTHCPQGHPYSGDNVKFYRRPGGNHTSRYCRACNRDRVRRKKASD